MARGWEYATVTQDGGREQLEVHYAGQDRVAHQDAPTGALPYVLGALGGREWELVSVTASWRADSHYVTQFYFKRPHDGHRGAEELTDTVRDAAFSAGLASHQ
jgi:hypothetical protein